MSSISGSPSHTAAPKHDFWAKNTLELCQQEIDEGGNPKISLLSIEFFKSLNEGIFFWNRKSARLWAELLTKGVVLKRFPPDGACKAIQQLHAKFGFEPSELKSDVQFVTREKRVVELSSAMLVNFSFCRDFFSSEKDPVTIPLSATPYSVAVALKQLRYGEKFELETLDEWLQLYQCGLLFNDFQLIALCLEKVEEKSQKDPLWKRGLKVMRLVQEGQKKWGECKWNEAQEMFMKALVCSAWDPKDKSTSQEPISRLFLVHLYVAQMSLAQSDPDAAETHLQLSLDLAPNQPHLLILQAKAALLKRTNFLRIEKKEQQQHASKRAELLAGVEKLTPRLASETRALADKYYPKNMSEQQLLAAEKLLNEVILTLPDHEEAHRLLGKTYLKLRKWEDAKKSFEKLLKFSLNGLAVGTWIAKAHLLNRELAVAERLLVSLYKQGSTGRTLQLLILLYLLKEEVTEVRFYVKRLDELQRFRSILKKLVELNERSKIVTLFHALDQARQEDPAYIALFLDFLYACAHSDWDDQPSCQKYLELVIAIDPCSLRALFLLAEFAFEANDGQAAAAYLQRLLPLIQQIEKGEEELIELIQGSRFAYHVLKALITLNLQDKMALLSDHLQKKGQFEPLINDAEEALEAEEPQLARRFYARIPSPTTPDQMYRLGELALQLGEEEEAFLYFSDSFREKPAAQVQERLFSLLFPRGVEVFAKLKSADREILLNQLLAVPALTEDLCQRICLHFLLTRTEEEEMHWHCALSLDQNCIEALKGLAERALQRKNPIEAIAFFSRIFAIDPSQVSVQTSLIKLLILEKEPQERILSLHPVERMECISSVLNSPVKTEQTYLTICCDVLYEAAHDTSDRLHQILDIDPSYTLAWMALSNRIFPGEGLSLSLKESDREELIGQIRDEDDEAEYRDLVLKFLLKRGLFELLVKLDPTCTEALNQLALDATKKGNLEVAADYLRRSLPVAAQAGLETLLLDNEGVPAFAHIVLKTAIDLDLQTTLTGLSDQIAVLMELNPDYKNRLLVYLLGDATLAIKEEAFARAEKYYAQLVALDRELLEGHMGLIRSALLQHNRPAAIEYLQRSPMPQILESSDLFGLIREWNDPQGTSFIYELLLLAHHWKPSDLFDAIARSNLLPAVKEQLYDALAQTQAQRALFALLHVEDELQVGLGRVLNDLEESEQRELISQLKKANPQNGQECRSVVVPFLIDLAKSSYPSDLQKAKAKLQQAHAIDPSSAPVLQGLTVCADQEGDVATSFNYAFKWLRVEPSQELLAKILEHEMGAESAVKIVDLFKSLSPIQQSELSASFYDEYKKGTKQYEAIFLAYIFKLTREALQETNIKKAIHYLSHFEQRAFLVENVELILNQIRKAVNSLSSHDEAGKAFQEADLKSGYSLLTSLLQACPDLKEAHNLGGDIARRLSWYPEAIKHLNQSLKIDPLQVFDLPNLLYDELLTHGKFLCLGSQIEEGLTFLKEGRKINPSKFNQMALQLWLELFNEDERTSVQKLIQDLQKRDPQQILEEEALSYLFLSWGVKLDEENPGKGDALFKQAEKIDPKLLNTLHQIIG